MHTGESVYDQQELIFRISQIIEMLKLDNNNAAEQLMRDLIGRMDCEEDRDELGVILDEYCEERYAGECQLRDNRVRAEWMLRVARACNKTQDWLICAGIGIWIAALIAGISGASPTILIMIPGITVASLLLVIVHVLANKRTITLSKEYRRIVRDIPDEKSIANKFLRNSNRTRNLRNTILKVN